MSNFSAKLNAADARRQREFFNSIRRNKLFVAAWKPRLSGVVTLSVWMDSLVRLWFFWMSWLAGLCSFRLPILRTTGVVASLTTRRVVAAGGLVVVSSVAVAASLATAGYLENDKVAWTARINARRMTAMWLRDGPLMGAVAPNATLDFQRFGYIDVGPPPPVYVRTLLALEDKHFGTSRSICGLDLLGTLTRWLSFQGGGSTLAMQLHRDLSQTGGESGLRSIARKFYELGGACRLDQELGDEGIVSAYASIAPVVMAQGTTRGLGGGVVLFDKRPDQFAPHEQALLAAAHKRNIRPVDRQLAAQGCISPVPALRRYCQTFERAAFGLRQVLPAGVERDKELAALESLAKTGLQPKNPLEHTVIPARRLANLTLRGAAAVPAAVRAQLVEEIDEGLVNGPSVELSMDSAHDVFSQRVTTALRNIETHRWGLFCAALTPGGHPRHCAGVTRGNPLRAEVTVLRADVSSGGIERLFQTSPFGLRQPMDVGSISKLVIALAAVRAGIRSDTLVCPRAASTNRKALLRVNSPRAGYRQCHSSQLISLANAMANSDSLAMYELARNLGHERLLAASQALGLRFDSGAGTLAYQLAFGVQVATPLELVVLAQRVFGAAYGLQVISAPRVSIPKNGARPQPQLGLDAGQAAQLRILVEAPLQDGGTLGWANDIAIAGKSGTTSASVAPRVGERPYVAGKMAVLLERDRRHVLLSVVRVPDPPQALGVNSLRGGEFRPLLQVAVMPSVTSH